MKIGVIGAGNIGTALARRLVPQGHDVMLSFSRDEAGLADTAKAFGATSGTPREAVGFADVIALAVPWSSVKMAIAQAGPMAGKIVWDCTNPLKPDLSGLEVGIDTSGTEIIASLVAGARIVKGIPPFAELLHSDDPTVAGKPAGSFLCSDDEAAKAAVRSLLEALPADVVDAGPLTNARFVEPAAMLLVRLAYGLGLGVRISLTLSRS